MTATSTLSRAARLHKPRCYPPATLIAALAAVLAAACAGRGPLLNSERIEAVYRDGREVRYAVITERHHPDYLTEADLRRIYGEPAETAK